MDRNVMPAGKCKGILEAISSKSHVHRLLIAAALADGESVIETNIISEDMQATMDCLTALGAEIQVKENGIYVNPISRISKEEKNDKILLNPRESGSTARFILPVASVLCKQFEMIGSGKLPTRPFAPLCDCMRKNGAVISSDYVPLQGSGTLKPGTYALPGNVSSQYISGLMFALPLLEEDSDMLTAKLESKAYIDITTDVLKQFGIRMTETKDGYHIPGRQRYHTPGMIKADGDWSNAAAFLCMGAIAGEVKMTGLNLDSTQGDKEIVSVLEQFGAKVVREVSSVTVSSKSLKAIRIDVSQIPDLVPVLCIVAGLAEGRTVFENAGRLRMKESDRIATTKALLEVLGVRMEVVEENQMTNLYIEGVKEYNGGKIDGAGDHRIVMAAAVASLRATAEIEIQGAQAVNKSYPGFFDDFRKIREA